MTFKNRTIEINNITYFIEYTISSRNIFLHNILWSGLYYFVSTITYLLNLSGLKDNLMFDYLHHKILEHALLDLPNYHRAELAFGYCWLLHLIYVIHLISDANEKEETRLIFSEIKMPWKGLQTSIFLKFLLQCHS